MSITEELLADALIEVKDRPIPPIEVVAAPKTTGETLGFFRLEDAGTFRDVVKCLSSLVEEVTFEGSVDGIHVRQMDQSHVAMLDVTLPQAEFDKFEFVTVPEKPIRFTARADEILKRFKRIRKLDGLVCQVNSDALLMTIGGATKGINLLESSTSSLPLPNLTYKAKVTFVRGILVDTLGKMAEAGDHVRITATKEGVRFYSKSDSSFAEETMEKPDLVGLELEEDEVKSTYHIDYILNILKSISADIVTLEYSHNMPIRVTAALGNHGQLQFYLAPRVEDVEPPKKVVVEEQAAPAAENTTPPPETTTTEAVATSATTTAESVPEQTTNTQEEGEKPKKRKGRKSKKSS